MSDDKGEREELLESETARAVMLDEYYDAVESLKKGGALNRIMIEARNEAQAALSALVRVGPDKVNIIRELQWLVTRQEKLAYWISSILEGGDLANSDLTAEEQVEFRMLLNSTPKD